MNVFISDQPLHRKLMNTGGLCVRVCRVCRVCVCARVCMCLCMCVFDFFFKVRAYMAQSGAPLPR